MYRPAMPPAAAQGRYWEQQPRAQPAAAAAPYTGPRTAASSARPAPPGTTMWEQDEVWVDEEPGYATALAVASLVFRDEDEDEFPAGALQTNGGAAAAAHRPAAAGPSEKQIKCMTKRAYYKRRRKARLAAQYVLDGLLARVDAAIEARSHIPHAQARSSHQAPAAAAATAAVHVALAQHEQP